MESDSCDVVMAVLRVLYMLAQPRSTKQVVAESRFTSKLATLASSWGSLSGSGERLLSISAYCQDDVEEVICIVSSDLFSEACFVSRNVLLMTVSFPVFCTRYDCTLRNVQD